MFCCSLVNGNNYFIFFLFVCATLVFVDVAPAAQGGAPSPEDQHVSFKVLCPQKQIGLIIGKSGATINALNTRSGARVKISQNSEFFPGTEDRIITRKCS